MAINDFGEKIGGAKKDLWKARGLLIEDLLDMNDAEKTTYIKKDNVWKKPDYQELVDSGLSRRVVYFIKMIRDATPTKPVLSYSDTTPERIAEKQEGYISFVRDLRDAVMGLKTEADVLGFYQNYISPKYVIPRPHSYYVDISPEAFGCLDNKLLKASQIKNFRTVDKDIAKKQFCYSEADKQKAFEEAFVKQFDILSFDNDQVTFGKDYRDQTQVTVKLGYGRLYFYPQGEDADVSSWKEGTYFVIRDGKVLAKNLDTREAADEYVQKLLKATVERLEAMSSQTTAKKKGRTRFVPKQLKNIQRDGPDCRHGLPATGEKYMDVFGFKGGEFGNWMSENDRRASLDYGYDALMDMCKALNISTKDVSLGGRLSIAFGARGSGSALAHYEPLREVINLTKMRGAGSLAHEWAHALDDILGKALEAGKGTCGFMTENSYKKQVPSSVKNIVDSMKYKAVQGEDVVLKQKAEVEKQKEVLRKNVEYMFPMSRMSDEQKTRLSKLTDAYINNAKDCKERFIECVYTGTGKGNPDIDALSALRKEVGGHGLNKDQRISFAHYQNNLRVKIENVGVPVRTKTDFYENSILFDKMHSKTDHGYWQSTIEMFARAFACYVNDKIEGKSDYLVGHSEAAVSWHMNDRTKEMELVKAIPVGEERKAINLCFDEMIREFKELGLLHDFEPEKEVLQDRKPSLLEQIQNSEAKQTTALKENRYGQMEFEF